MFFSKLRRDVLDAGTIWHFAAGMVEADELQHMTKNNNNTIDHDSREL